MATMNKKEHNNYVVHVPHWLWWFVPHCFITPQHILEKPSKMDGQIFHASRKCNWDSTPGNSMTSTPHGSELQCKFGIFVRVYNSGYCIPTTKLNPRQ
jgi:hypothetical protein